jgi:hypothetical protein
MLQIESKGLHPIAPPPSFYLEKSSQIETAILLLGFQLCVDPTAGPAELSRSIPATLPETKGIGGSAQWGRKGE